jgi:hypothetical protein
LTLHGLVARGGLAGGARFADQQFIYGQAVNDAYALKNTLAHYPRIVQDGAVLPLFRSGSRRLQLSLFHGVDG